MIDETIGSMGNTHGVSESRTPAKKKTPTMGQKAPLRSTDSIAPDSPAAAPAVDVPAAAGATSGVVAAEPVPASALATGMTVPAPPKAARLTLAALCIGG